jgi:hypothetical protein
MAKLKSGEGLAVTGNAAILAIIHTVYGAFISYLFYYLFDEFNDNWKRRSDFYKLADVSMEIMLIATFGYWASELTEYIPSVFPTSKAHELNVDRWVSGIFFVIALFLFLDELTEKLKYLQNYYFETIFSNIFPAYGSLIDMNLSYTPITEEDKKKAESKTEPKSKIVTASAHAIHAE